MSSKVALILDSISVPGSGGQGASEGKLELRVSAKAGGRTVNWPNLHGSEQLSVGGAAQHIGLQIESFEIRSGSLSKTVTFEVTEVDKGLNGQDDTGTGSLVFDLTPGMKSTTKSNTVKLFRPNGQQKGKVDVKIRAEAL